MFGIPADSSNKYMLLAIPALLFLGLRIIGFDGLYGQDSYEYLRYSIRLQDFLTGGPFPGDLVWPKGYLFLSALLSFLIPVSLAGQLISLICLYLSFYFLYKSLALLYPNTKNRFAYLILAFLLSPYILRLSFVMMADTLAILCLSATAFYTLAYNKSQRFSLLIAAVFWASFAGFSRYATLVPIAPMLIWLLFSWFKSRQWKQFIVLLIPSGFFLVHLFFEANGSDFLDHHLVERWSFLNFFSTEFNAATGPQLPNVKYLLPNILFYTLGFFHPGFFILLPVLLIFLLKKKEFKAFPLPLWASLILYCLFLAGISFQGIRYLSLAYPLLILLFFPAFEGAIEMVNKRKTQLLFGLGLIQLALFSIAMLPSYQMNKLERDIALELEPFQNNTLYSFELDVSLQQRGLDFKYINLWAEDYNQFEKGALVLFNEERFSKAYEGKFLMNNWNKLNTDFELVEVKELPRAWKLYRING